MELQDRVTVTLTEHGAKILNEINKKFNDRYPKIKLFKTDYKGGDLFTSELYDLINSFNGHFNPGCYVCFKNIVPAEPPKDIFKSGTCKGREDPDESVSMEEYDMMSNAYKEAFDECTRLKDKLARIQELIKD